MDVERRYKIAVECNEIRTDGRYGENAVSRVAQHLGWSERKVGHYADVAATYNKNKFQELVSKTDKYGKPLSWWHYVELSQEPNGSRRRSLLSKTLRNGWSVRELAAARKNDPTSEDRNRSDANGPPDEQRILLSAVDEVLSEVDAFGGAWDKLPTKIEKGDAGDVTDALDRLKQARQNLDNQYQARAKLLDDCIKQLELRCQLEARKQEADKKKRPERPNNKAKGTRRKRRTAASNKRA
jgi:hypothetical protein